MGVEREVVKEYRRYRSKSYGRLSVLVLGWLLAVFPVLSAGAGQATDHLDSGLEALGFVKLQHDPDAPNFTLQDVSGRSVRLADYRGKVIFLTFWTTW